MGDRLHFPTACLTKPGDSGDSGTPRSTPFPLGPERAELPSWAKEETGLELKVSHPCFTPSPLEKAAKVVEGVTLEALSQ